ncbi:unnamed protein product [Caenorhabditis auriculariae]|uniref:CDT1 Geminin-binding domain-containing protein n=1 Tax=Caenorhabditis auriculariae TaxID=2777116 RepID=A0A8S1GSE5_9PELO|nr:unnamed protein product [Caenorhabditis auriculariae]
MPRASRRAAEPDNDVQAQAAVTDFFRVTRRPRGAAAAKKVLTEEDGPTQSIVKTETKTTTTRKTRAKTVETVEIVKEEVVKVEKIVEKTKDVQQEEIGGASPPKKFRSENITKSTRAKKVLFSEPLEEKVLPPPAPIPVEKTPEKLAQSSKSILSDISTASPKKKTKIRTVAELQAELAKRGAAKKVHQQNLQHKTKCVEAHAEFLKSPQKAPLGPAPVIKKTVKAKLPKLDKVVDVPAPAAVASEVPSYKREDEEAKMEAKEFAKNSKLVDIVRDSFNSEFSLPDSYEHLNSSFQHVDRIVGMITNQGRCCVMVDLIKNLRNTMKRDFDQKNFSQLLHVYPTSYKVEAREQWNAFGGTQTGKMELVVAPNLVDDMAGFLKDEEKLTEDETIPLVVPQKLLASPLKSPRKGGSALPVPRAPQLDARRRLDAVRMRDRSYVFRHKLVEIVKKHYDLFLKEKGLESMKANFRRLHPMFNPNKHCSAIPEAALPDISTKRKTNIGMREYVAEETGVVKLPAFVLKAIEEMRSPTKACSSDAVPLSPAKFVEMKKNQTAGGLSLLERIRAKEAAKKAEEACHDADKLNRKNMLIKLGDRFLRSLCCLYATKKARSMELNVVAERLVFSHTSPITKQEVIQHLELLCQVAPKTVSESVVMGRRYLQVLENNFDALYAVVQEELKTVEVAMKQDFLAPRPPPIAQNSTKKAVRTLF